MNRDSQMVLERWAGWAASEHSGVDYSHIAAGFKDLLPQKGKMRLACSDNDGLIIESCLCRLKEKRPNEHALVVMHYLYDISKRQIARMQKKDEKLIRIELQMAEGFIDGCLTMIEVKLDMDVEFILREG